MTFLFFAGLIVLIFGLSSMNWLAIVLAVGALGYAITKLDDREQEKNRQHFEALRQEQVARGNGHPRGNVDLIAKSGGES